MFWKRKTPGDEFMRVNDRFVRGIAERNYEMAMEATKQIFALAEKSCRENPSRSLELTYAAAECESRADWEGAELAYQNILALPDVTPAEEFRAHTDLVGLCRILNRDSDALSHARSATWAARRADSTVLLLMALQAETRCLIRRQEFREAQQVIAEAQSVIEDDQMYNQLRASFLIFQAECAIHRQTISEAEQCLEAACSLLEPLASFALAAGAKSSLCHWWSVSAQLRAKKHDTHGAINAWREAVQLARHVDSLPHTANVYTKVVVAGLLEELSKSLLTGGRNEDAASARDERKDILKKAGVPDGDFKR